MSRTNVYSLDAAQYDHDADVAQLAEQCFCKASVMGSTPIVGSGGRVRRRDRPDISITLGQCPERQRGRTVNPLAIAFVGSSPTWPTGIDLTGRRQKPRSSAGSVADLSSRPLNVSRSAHVAQLAERILGKNEVMGSNPIVGFPPRP